MIGTCLLGLLHNLREAGTVTAGKKTRFPVSVFPVRMPTSLREGPSTKTRWRLETSASLRAVSTLL